MTEKVIEIRKLCKSVGRQKILHNISFDIMKGEVFGLIGPNGAGKTTLMKILAGLMQGDSGSVKCHVPGKGKIGVLLEFPAAYDWLSGYQNLKILASMYQGVTEADIVDITRLVGLEEDIHKKYRDFSVGMKQRLGIAIALLNQPELLILDEPTNGLDFDGICEMRTLIGQLTGEKYCTVILSSHILDEMDRLCNRVAFIKKGEITGVVDEEVIHSEGLETKYKELVGVGRNDEKNVEKRICQDMEFADESDFTGSASIH
ncbi:ABC transporter ATP-binding protein [Petralouisia muris]|uniref:ABC transporter ATP-binding protein n=1 Tax=Petralouisia muris TaxID=3032872 RepID=UPI0014410274|nr:ABC transporter ATP-binding protein [Petralouisia muris]